MELLHKVEQEVELIGRHEVVDELIKNGTTRAVQWMSEHPEVADKAFSLLRKLRPVLHINQFALVTRFDDVCEVLQHPKQFTVAKYRPRMEELAGPFILGLDGTPEYDHDVSVLRLAIRRDDVPGVGRKATEEARKLVDAAVPSGRIDVVQQLCDLVPARVVGHYFGVPGPDEATLVEWTRRLFRDIFINLVDDPTVRQDAATAAAEFLPYLDSAIAERKRMLGTPDAAGLPDDVLSRLLRLHGGRLVSVDDDWIRTNLFGLIVGFIPTISKATALAMDALLARQDALAGAHTAAASGDDETVATHVFEAMRLFPQTPGLFRVCETDYVLAQGTDRAKPIPKGTLVLACTQSAMMDETVVDHPEDFRLDRPAWRELHFGFGLHTCFGQYISEVQIPAICAALLRHGPVRRAPGDVGKLSYDGPFPSSMTVEFERTAVD